MTFKCTFGGQNMKDITYEKEELSCLPCLIQIFDKGIRE